jgi:cell division transport system permease protein
MSKFLRTIGRAVKSGFVKFGRLYYISFPLSIFFALVITMCGLLSFIYGFAGHMTSTLNDRVNIVVYFDRQSPDTLTSELVTKIREYNNVKRVDFSDKDRNLEVFKERNKDNAVAMQALSEVGVNPFGASLVVYAKDTRNYEDINNFIKSLAESYKANDGTSPIEDVTYEEHKVAIEKFAGMLRKGEAAVFALALILAGMLIFVLFLAQRLAAQYDREEIKIMKIVGAPNTLILGPSAVMGALTGFIGGVIALFVLYYLALKATSYTTVFDNFDMLYWYTNNINTFILYGVGVATLAGFVFSLFAARRHL